MTSDDGEEVGQHQLPQLASAHTLQVKERVKEREREREREKKGTAGTQYHCQ